MTLAQLHAEHDKFCDLNVFNLAIINFYLLKAWQLATASKL